MSQARAPRAVFAADHRAADDDAVNWLLEDDESGVRYLALRDLAQRQTAAELAAAQRTAHTRGPIATILDHMHGDGYWAEPGPGYNPKYRATVWSMVLLAQLGAGSAQDPRIDRACAYVLDHALMPGGQFTASGAPSGTADCLQGELCAALTALGCTDARLEAAFDWMARTVTGEGIAPREDRAASIRYYAGKCGPNFACGSNGQLPCAWGAVKVMLALGLIPKRRRTQTQRRAIQQGVDFLLGIDPAQANYPAAYSARPSRNWWKFGFPVFYVTDLLQVVEALAALGLGRDPRLAQALQLIRDKQDPQGRWSLEYDYNGKTWLDFGRPGEPNKWVTYRALRALKAAATA